jgi:hypothetical protein
MIDRSVPTLTASRETAAATYNGLAILGVAAFGPALILGGMAADVPLLLIPGALLLAFLAPGFYMIQPNQAAAILLFGAYRGTDRAEGLRWVWPWMIRKRISVRANNLISDQIKVNDLRGNPIEMAAQVVWRVTDSAQALFDVDDYYDFVDAQVEAAIRAIGARYPYDDFEHQEVTLRGHHDEVGAELDGGRQPAGIDYGSGRQHDARKPAAAGGQRAGGARCTQHDLDQGGTALYQRGDDGKRSADVRHQTDGGDHLEQRQPDAHGRGPQHAAQHGATLQLAFHDRFSSVAAPSSAAVLAGGVVPGSAFGADTA